MDERSYASDVKSRMIVFSGNVFKFTFDCIGKLMLKAAGADASASIIDLRSMAAFDFLPAARALLCDGPVKLKLTPHINFLADFADDTPPPPPNCLPIFARCCRFGVVGTDIDAFVSTCRQWCSGFARNIGWWQLSVDALDRCDRLSRMTGFGAESSEIAFWRDCVSVGVFGVCNLVLAASLLLPPSSSTRFNDRLSVSSRNDKSNTSWLFFMDIDLYAVGVAVVVCSSSASYDPSKLCPCSLVNATVCGSVRSTSSSTGIHRFSSTKRAPSESNEIDFSRARRIASFFVLRPLPLPTFGDSSSICSVSISLSRLLLSSFVLCIIVVDEGVGTWSTSGKWKYVECLYGSEISGEYVNTLQSVWVSCAVYIGDECVLGGLL